MAEYLFVDTGKEKLQEGTGVITIKDLTPGKKKYKHTYVRAELASDPKKLPGADVLWIRGPLGYMRGKPWAIKIIENVPVY